MRDFYSRETLTVAKELLGKVLVHNKDNITTSGIIVEVEAYKGNLDKAAHSYNRKTARVKHMYGRAGVAYVYFIYGMYYCMNVVTRKEGIAEAVLIRAIEPVNGLEVMSQRRFKTSYEKLNKRKIQNLTSGPGKLCIALGIDKSNNGQDLEGHELYIEDSVNFDFVIKSSKRIGIDYAEEAKDFLWRFYIGNNPFVSK